MVVVLKYLLLLPLLIWLVAYFSRPCRLGDVVMIAAMVNRTFSSSMEVGVRVEAEEMTTGLR